MNQPPRRIVVAYGSNLNFEDLAKIADIHIDTKSVHRGILFGYRLAFTRRSENRQGGVLDIVQAKNSAVPVIIFSVDWKDYPKLASKEGVSSGCYKETELCLWDMDSCKFCTAIGFQVMTPETYVEPSSDYVGIVREGYRRFGFPEAVLDAAVDNKPFPMQEFFQWLLKGGAIGSSLGQGGAFTHREDWGGEHFVISPTPRSPRDRDDIAYIQRNREECRRLVDFMYFMKQFAYTKDDPMTYRYVIGMLGETCSEYAEASYAVLCEKLIARAVELLK